eukprot:TRINITY_DN14135_c0_g1_i1.p1 TRINITY_DN14135_c0_g1~~TRINITY_DN14135_c0_g1_i1.p1  ORF type:complete len:284 (+),score=19.46 TRINITY_DN14135_c0_g1_i1:20-871(+)
MVGKAPCLPRCPLRSRLPLKNRRKDLFTPLGPEEVAAAVRSLSMSYVAVFLLIGGTLIVVGSTHMMNKPNKYKGESESDDAAHPTLLEAHEGGALSASDSDGSSAVTRKHVGHVLFGLMSAMAVGLFGGSILVPFRFIPAHEAGLVAMPSFGLGALTFGAILIVVRWSLIRGEKGCAFSPTALAVGILSGVTWNAGNVCEVVVQGPPFNLPYGIAYPILQCAPLFGGVWGICVFREIRGTAIFFFVLGALELLAGIFILSVYGPGAESGLSEFETHNALNRTM